MCGSTVGGLSTKGIDVAKESVIQGTVTREGQPVPAAYVRLLDSTGEFTAEVVTSSTGQFRFFAAPGPWTLRTLVPRTPPVDRPVQASPAQLSVSELRRFYRRAGLHAKVLVDLQPNFAAVGTVCQHLRQLNDRHAEGYFALVLLHDLNANHRFNVSTDGIGFPNNPALGWSKPSAAATRAVAGPGLTRIRIILNYRHGFSFRPGE